VADRRQNKNGMMNLITVWEMDSARKITAITETALISVTSSAKKIPSTQICDRNPEFGMISDQ
jgi:hypothetical protein